MVATQGAGVPLVPTNPWMPFLNIYTFSCQFPADFHQLLFTLNKFLYRSSRLSAPLPHSQSVIAHPPGTPSNTLRSPCMFTVGAIQHSCSQKMGPLPKMEPACTGFVEEMTTS